MESLSVAAVRKRVPTGIDGLDDLIEGGFPEGSVILLAGGAGSGKTIFSTQFIYNGAVQYGEKGVYVTFEEDAKTLKRNMLNFGFDLEKLEREGLIKVIDLEVLKGEGLNTNIECILNAIDELDAKRLVIDSLTAFLASCPEKLEYRIIMHLIYKILKTRDCTTIMTCSVPLGAKTLGLGIEEFIADSLIFLENIVSDLELKTRLLIHKMRGTNHSKRYHNVLMTEKGIQIVSFAVT
ncbi:MAG: ATPase domain-containing protein [Candidatus Bathyarchaeia archaeon]